MQATAQVHFQCSLLMFSGMSKGICLPEDTALLRAISKVVPSWPHTLAKGNTNDIVARVVRNPGILATYDISSAYVDEPMTGLSAASAVCAVLADILEAHVEESDSQLTLHCGAVAFGKKLVVLTGPRRAGKSTLIGRLCAEPDVQIFCDDVLPINMHGEGIALGIAPRLRLPLPAQASPQFKKFVGSHLGPRDDRYGYLCSGNVATHGTRLPLGAIVVLDRQNDTPAQLRWMTEDDTLYFALEQNMGQFESPQAALNQAHDLIGNACCVRLIYSDLDEAVALLRQAFDCHEPINPATLVKPAQAWAPPAIEKQIQASVDLVFMRAPAAAVRRIGNSAFLWQAGDHSIWRLNSVGEAVWALLEIPGSAKELSAILGEVFVQVPAHQLEADVCRVLTLMQELEFVTPALC